MSCPKKSLPASRPAKEDRVFYHQKANGRHTTAVRLQIHGPGGQCDPDVSAGRDASVAPSRPLQPVLRAMLVGTRCLGSLLHKLQKQPLLLKRIFEDVAAYNSSRCHICASEQATILDWGSRRRGPVEPLDVGFVICGRKLAFPRYRGGINVNMMPFIMGELTSLPADLHGYRGILEALPISKGDRGKVGYLTIAESLVPVDGTSTQRRKGLHVECPGEFTAPCKLQPGEQHAWGRGTATMIMEKDVYEGGIYMCSNISGTTRVFDAQVEYDIIGRGGDVEHLRGLCGRGTELDAGDLVWITDRTPHEALPIPVVADKLGGEAKGEGDDSPPVTVAQRQFFRVVTSEITVWYQQHNTANPFGIRPPPEVEILYHDKFDE